MGQKPRGHPSFWPFETRHNKPNPLLGHRPATCGTLRAGKRAAWNTYPLNTDDAEGEAGREAVASGILPARRVSCAAHTSLKYLKHTALSGHENERQRAFRDRRHGF